MKKSFFKRAVATVAAVPLALTQFMTSSSVAVDDSVKAVADADNASSSSLTLNDLLRIEPDTPENPDNVQVSNWNEVHGATFLLTAEGTSTILDTSALESLIVSNAGKYESAVKGILDQLGDVKAEVIDGKITITAQIGDISGVIADEAQSRINTAISEVESKYPEVDFSDLHNVDFSRLSDATGSFTATIDLSNIEKSTNMPVTVDFVTSDDENYGKFILKQYSESKEAIRFAVGKVFADVQAQLDDAAAKLADAKNSVAEAQAKLDEAVANGVNVDEAQAELDAKKAELAEAEADYNEALAEFKNSGAEAEAKIEETLNGYDDMIKKVFSFADKYLDPSFSTEKMYGTTFEALAAAKKFATDKKLPGASKIPSSISSALSSAAGADAYASIMNSLSSIIGQSINISGAELGAAVDSFKNIKLTVKDGVWTINARFDDAEQQEVID